ncbi:MAG: TlpA family protein disulfide reductase, partial [Acidobacteria bacterium]|nr:TlpA family protein disulfide reductase [Acidobacteriota bacterium]
RVTGRRRFLLSAVAILVVSIAGGWLLSRAGDDSSSNEGVVVLSPGSTSQDPTIGTNALNTGKAFPVVQIESLDGEPVTLGEPTGKPFLVNFWYSTCEPCKREMPALVAAQEKYGIDVVGVNPRDTAELARDFAEEYGITYPLLRDPNGASLVALGVGTFPMTYLVSGDGTILEQHAGEITAAQLDRMLAPIAGSQ